MEAEELFTFVTHPAVPGTNNESERTLRDAANDRKTGRTSKTLCGARRRTVLTSVLESLRLSLPDFTLAHVLEEVTDWLTSGRSRFRQLPESLNLATARPLPSGNALPRNHPLTTDQQSSAEDASRCAEAKTLDTYAKVAVSTVQRDVSMYRGGGLEALRTSGREYRPTSDLAQYTDIIRQSLQEQPARAHHDC